MNSPSRRTDSSEFIAAGSPSSATLRSARIAIFLFPAASLAIIIAILLVKLVPSTADAGPATDDPERSCCIYCCGGDPVYCDNPLTPFGLFPHCDHFCACQDAWCSDDDDDGVINLCDEDYDWCSYHPCDPNDPDYCLHNPWDCLNCPGSDFCQGYCDAYPEDCTFCPYSPYCDPNHPDYCLYNPTDRDHCGGQSEFCPPEDPNDCNGNGLPDAEEADPDSPYYDPNNPISQDCDGNGVPDICQMDDDSNGNGTPDVCEAPQCADSVLCEDCNGNGVADGEEIRNDCRKALGVASIKAGKCAGTVVRGAKVAQEARAASKAVKFIQSARSSPGKLGRNLVNAGHCKPPGAAAHHIVPGGKAGAEEARDILTKWEIDIIAAENGVLLPHKADSKAPGARHPPLHTDRCIEYVTHSLREARGRDEATQVRDRVRKELLKGTCPP